MELTTGEIAERLGGKLTGDAAIAIHGVADAQSAVPGQITFAEDKEYLQAADDSASSAILVKEGAGARSKPAIEVANVRVALAQLLEWLHPEESYPPGIHPSAIVDETAEVAETAYVGPGCVISAGVKIADGVCLLGGNHIGTDSVLGEQTKLFPGATVYGRCHIGKQVRIHSGAQIGVDGFHYVFDGQQHRKILDIGRVIIGDRVEIGANTTVDRGALRDTEIGEGTKIDNLVQIAHNVVIGKHCIIVSQVGIAGSTTIGDFTVIAGQVGIAGHLKIGSQVTIAAKAGVMRDIPDGKTMLGAPAVSDRDFKRQIIAIQQLPDMMKRFKALEKKLS